jgi:Ankyrin repeat
LVLAEYPALLSWQGDDNDGGLLGIATGAYADSFDPDREQVFTRLACAELLIDAGVLDTALAFSVINRHFDVADYLLEHGADINTNWSSHEPSSILHELVGQVATGENRDGNYEPMRFLIDRGIDMTIKDYRWNSTARGWALYAAKDQKMAQWLEDAERQREPRR